MPGLDVCPCDGCRELKPVRCSSCGCEFLQRGELDFCRPCLELQADATIDELELAQLERARRERELR